MTTPTMSVNDALRQARERVLKGWCQGAIARDKDGETIEFNSAVAVAYCTTGGIAVVTGGAFDLDTLETNFFHWDVIKAFEDANDIGMDLGHDNIGWWNDGDDMTQAKVVKGFDKAIHATSPIGTTG